MPASQYERVLAAEMLVVMGVQTADALSGQYSNTGQGGGGKFLPAPSRYFATVIVYLALAGMAMFGPKPGRLAATFGGVAALAILLAPSAATGEPLAMSAIVYMNQILTGGLQQPGVANPNANGELPGGATGVTTNPGATAGGQALLTPGPPGQADITPGNTGRFLTGTPSSVPPAV